MMMRPLETEIEEIGGFLRLRFAKNKVGSTKEAPWYVASRAGELSSSK
jgi:hypothetical protein